MQHLWLISFFPLAGFLINGLLGKRMSKSFVSAVAIGSVAGGILYFSLSAFESRRIDDPVGAISVHGVNGIWGTLAVGLFAEDQYVRNSLGYSVNGLFFGGGMDLLGVQSLAVVSVFLWAFPLSWVFF